MEKTKSEDFIYETKVNAIYSDGVYYYLLHFKTGKVWRFDKDKAVLGQHRTNATIRIIQQVPNKNCG